jgi:hypothetical protein
MKRQLPPRARVTSLRRTSDAAMVERVYLVTYGKYFGMDALGEVVELTAKDIPLAMAAQIVGRRGPVRR